MNLPLVITSKREKGRGLATKIGFPTINCLSNLGVELGVYASLVHSKYDWLKEHAISNVSKNKHGGIRIETHILNWNPREEFNVDDEVNILLVLKLRDHRKITVENLREMINSDRESAKEFFCRPLKCESCKFFMMEDYGYSNWTVEGTNYSCLKGCFGQTEDRYITFARKDCVKHSEGDPWHIDVDHESELPTKEWLEENECVYEA